MKNRKLFTCVLSCVLVLMLSVNVFAATMTEGEFTLSIESEVDSIEKGDQIKLTINLESNDGTIDYTTKNGAAATFGISFDQDVFTMEEDLSTSESEDNSWAYAINIGANSGWGAQVQTTLRGSKSTARTVEIDGPLAIVVLDVTGDVVPGKEYKFEFVDPNINENDLDVTPATSVTATGCSIVGAGGSKNEAEEIFDSASATAPGASTITGDDGSTLELSSAAKQVAVFGKAPADAALEAYSYGIIFGGKEFAGAAKVNAGDAWCIKLIAPNGIIGEELKNDDEGAFEGTYAVTIFRGEATFATNSVTVE